MPHSHQPSCRGTPRASRKRSVPSGFSKPAVVKLPPTRSAPVRRGPGLPGFALGPAALSILLHGVVLSMVAGAVLIQHPEPKVTFEVVPGVELPMVIETVQAPEEVEETPSPGSDEGAPATAMGDLDQPVIDPAITIISASSGANAFLVPSSVGLKTGTAMVGLGNQGIGKRQGSGKGKGGPGVTAKEIFGMQVKADHIAVVLDCSGSMLGVLEPVITEILASFPNAIIIGAQGCAIFQASVFPLSTRLEPVNDTRDPSAKYLSKSLPYEQQKTSLWASRGPGVAMVEQANGGLVQAIYWFADFQDPIDPKGMDEITDALVRAGIRLYIHSVEKDPAPSIKRAVEKTGGEILIKRLK